MKRIAWGYAVLTALVTGPAMAAGCDLAKAPDVPVIKGLPYTQARTSILASVWKPVQGRPHNDFSNNESTFRDRGFTELQFCTSRDDSPCRFEFTAAGYDLWVTTLGEENAALGTVATVSAAKLSCAGDRDPG